MGVVATWKGEKTYAIRLGNDQVVEVREHHPRSGDLVLAGLVACSGRTFRDILQRMRVEVESIEILAEAEQDPDPPNAFRRVRVHWDIRLGQAPAERVQRAVDLAEKYCTVLCTLKQGTEVATAVSLRP